MTPVSFSSDCKSSPEIACARILSEEGLKTWWVGNVKIVQRDPSWPAVKSKMSWRAGGGLFSAQIVEDARPRRVVMEVMTPSAKSKITNSFEPLPAGGTRYTKSVEPTSTSIAFRIMWPLFRMMLQSFVKKEVKRGAAFADASK